MFKLLLIISRIVVGSTLAIAVVAKLANFRWFVGVIGSYKLWTSSLDLPIATAVIGAELIIAPLIFVGSHTAAWCAVAMFIIFGLLTTRNLVKKKIDPGCGCFGPKGKPISWQLLLRNISCAGLAWLIAASLRTDVALLSWVVLTSMFFLAIAPMPLKQKSNVMEA